MKNKGLTITFIVKAFPINYDQGYGNVSVAKKVHRGDGSTYLFTSRQALRYSLVNWLVENKDWDWADLTTEQKVIQYDPKKLKESLPEEADLFGYMITSGKRPTRSAVARLTHLISLEPYYGDQELLTNKNFADRLGKEMDMANVETDLSYYKYSLSIDLDKVGVDENFNHNIPKEEKIKRVCDLLEATKYLYRDIRGRREDLKPLFVIGGVYPIKSVFFHDPVQIYWRGSKAHLNWDAINQVLESEFDIEEDKKKVKDYTIIGIKKGEFGNGREINLSPFEAIDKIKEKVKEAFES